MAMATGFYNPFKTKLLSDANTIAFAADTIKVMLVTNAYTPDFDAHDFVNDVTNEVSGTGYTAGGQALANKTVTQDSANDRGVFDADDALWTSATITARGCVIYKDTGTPSTSPLIRAIDFGSDIVASGGDFRIAWNAGGIIRTE